MSESPRKRPRKSSSKKKIQEEPLTISPQQNPDLGKLDKEKISQLLQQTALRYKDSFNIEEKIKLKELTHLSSIIEEYLSCFLIIGYTLQDERAILWNGKSAKDEAALLDLLRVTFIENMGK